MSFFVLGNNQSSPVSDGSFQFTRGASGLIGVLDMFGFENSQVRHVISRQYSLDAYFNFVFVSVCFICKLPSWEKI